MRPEPASSRLVLISILENCQSANIYGVTQVKRLTKFLRDEQGAELAEYAIGVAILVAIAIIVYNVLGTAINTKMTAVASEIEG
jgi:Flp pilus assembly pilin Flp